MPNVGVVASCAEIDTRERSIMVLNKYLAGLLTLAITVLTAAVAVPETAWRDAATIWQFAGLVVSTIVTVFLPLSKGRWAAAIKVIGSLAAAVVANVVAFLTSGGEWGIYQWLLLGLAILLALAAELGVNIRIDSTKEALASPQISTTATKIVDPQAVAVVAKTTAVG